MPTKPSRSTKKWRGQSLLPAVGGGGGGGNDNDELKKKLQKWADSANTGEKVFSPQGGTSFNIFLKNTNKKKNPC
jgi:hypothetical protein